MKFRNHVLVTAIILAVYQPAMAQTVVVDKISSSETNMDHMAGERESRLYYKMGGARPVSEPPSQAAEIKLGGSAVIGPGYSCGKFDPVNSLQNFFNNLEKGLDNAVKTIENAATSAIAALPMMAVQRNSPGLYEMLQNNIFRAEEKWRFSAMSCQEMERRIAQGQNPYKAYMEYSQGESLQEEAMSNPDAVTAMDNVAQGGGDSGFYMPVPDKGIVKAGGKNQEPIKPVTSTTIAGYNMLMGSSDITSTSKPLDMQTEYETQGQMARHFSTPTEMADWVSTVVGEDEVYTTNSPKSPPQTKAATGLVVKASHTQDSIKTILYEARRVDDKSSQEDLLRKLPSTGSVNITPDLMKRIRSHGPGVEGMLLHNLAGEMALASEIEKALVARRALMVGLSERNIASASPVREEVERKIARLEKDIDQAMFEYRLRKELVSDLATTIYEEDVEGVRQTIKEKRSELPELRNVKSKNED
ncbi:integrating conjugative element protein [Thiomicrospira sp.]|uniref:integrating conjugative element protein n=1 Tax=Thiomicrospira sp. TaxID=935 RepID=UPI002F932F76